MKPVTDDGCQGEHGSEESDEDEEAPAGAETVGAEEDFVEKRWLTGGVGCVAVAGEFFVWIVQVLPRVAEVYTRGRVGWFRWITNVRWGLCGVRYAGSFAQKNKCHYGG